MRRHPLRRASGVSATSSSGASRAWKSSARVYSGSLVRIGGGSSVAAKTASHTSSVRDGRWSTATSWYAEAGPGFTVSTSCSSSAGHGLAPAPPPLLGGSGRVHGGSPRAALGSGTGNEYCASTA